MFFFLYIVSSVAAKVSVPSAKTALGGQRIMKDRWDESKELCNAMLEAEGSTQTITVRFETYLN